MEKEPFSGPEKRKSKRIDQPYNVRIRVRSHSNEDWNLVLIRDISNGGILFNNHQEIAIGTLLDLKINIVFEEPPIECSAKVLRCRALGQSGLYEVGLQFEPQDFQNRQKIDRAVEKFEVEKSKEEKP